MNTLAQTGGPLLAIGVVGLFLGRSRNERLIGLVVFVCGGWLAFVGFVPRGLSVAPVLLVALVFAVVVAGFVFALMRLPWLLPVLVLSCVPLRFPVQSAARSTTRLCFSTR